MAQWPYAAVPHIAKPPMALGIPEEWEKANKALQAVQQPNTTESSSVSEQNGGVNNFSPFRWQQPMYPTYPGYAGYPPSYGYYNYNFGYPYFVNPVPPTTPMPPVMTPTSSENKTPPIKVEEKESENLSVSSLTQPPPPPPASPPTSQPAFFTNITSQAPNSGGIKFNLPKKKDGKTAFQATRQALQERMDNFCNENSPQAERNMAQSIEEETTKVSSMDLDCWPQPLKNYVARCFEKCETSLDKDQVELVLKGKLMTAKSDGSIITKDWDNEPLPSIHSDRLKQEQQQQQQHNQSLYQKLQNNLKNQDKKMSTPNSRNFQNRSRVGLYHSTSRSHSRSRSRSRTPPKKCFRRRKYSSSSESSGDSKGSKKTLSSSVINPDTRSVKNTPNSTKNKKKRKKGKQPFTVDQEFCTDERLMKRAARFENENGKSPKANILFTISNTPSFTIDENGADMEWGSDAVIGTCLDLEKPFLRLTGAVDPTSVRPEEVLVKSLAMVKKHWIENQDYHFACEQLKSIRQDLVVQCIRNKFTVQVYETHARIALEKGDHTEFNQCQSQLKVLFQEVKEGNRLEFTGYHILYTMYTENEIELKNILADLKIVEKQDEVVSHALKLAKACSSNNYSRFFKLYISAPKMSSFIIDWFIEKIRKAALKAFIKSFRPNIPISYIQSALAFPSTEECLAFLTKANIVFVDAGLINCKESVGPLVNF